MSHPTYNSPARGRKQCIKCKVYVGVRVQICNCGHTFTAGEKLIELTDEQKELVYYINVLGGTINDYIVFAPIEKINEKPEEISRDCIFDWADNIIDQGKKINKIYTPEALKYFLGNVVGFDTEEYIKGRQFIQEWRNSL